jgi:hypothetical protein
MCQYANEEDLNIYRVVINKNYHISKLSNFQIKFYVSKLFQNCLEKLV